METRTAWVLFVVTMVLHSATFIFLQLVADKFQRYMTISDGDPGNATSVAEVTAAGHMTNPPLFKTTTLPGGAGRMYYHELHQTLDVSIFK
jgi:hypothetical protein